MWKIMKTHYIQNEEDFGEILLNNMNKFSMVFELNKNNILQSLKKTIPDMDSVLLKAKLTSLQIQKTNSSKSLVRKNSREYLVSCINIKNKEGECFSSLIDYLCESDRIIIINGVILELFTICNSDKLTILVRPQDNSSIILFKYRNLLEKSNSILEKNCSCSPSFFHSQSESLIFNQDNRYNSFESNIVNQPRQCIGPCRLICSEPNLFDSGEIVSGYCTNCSGFFQKRYLNMTTKSSNKEYKCPECSTIVHLTFFFIMNFVYGKNESQAIEVRCYDKKAERILTKISKKEIKLEDYLLNQNDQHLVISSIKSLINDRTKVNIIVHFSTYDNKNILLGIDTKYVVTTTTH